MENDTRIILKDLKHRRIFIGIKKKKKTPGEITLQLIGFVSFFYGASM